MDFREHITVPILEIMRMRGITASDLAAILKGKVSRAAVYKFVGGTPVQIDTLAHICTALGLVTVIATEDSQIGKREMRRKGSK